MPETAKVRGVGTMSGARDVSVSTFPTEGAFRPTGPRADFHPGGIEASLPGRLRCLGELALLQLQRCQRCRLARIKGPVLCLCLFSNTMPARIHATVPSWVAQAATKEFLISGD